MSSDEELDFASQKFNPEKVLTFSNVRAPIDDAEEYGHMDELRIAVHSQAINKEITGEGVSNFIHCIISFLYYHCF